MSGFAEKIALGGKSAKGIWAKAGTLIFFSGTKFTTLPTLRSGLEP